MGSDNWIRLVFNNNRIQKQLEEWAIAEAQEEKESSEAEEIIPKAEPTNPGEHFDKILNKRVTGSKKILEGEKRITREARVRSKPGWLNDYRLREV